MPRLQPDCRLWRPVPAQKGRTRRVGGRGGGGGGNGHPAGHADRDRNMPQPDCRLWRPVPAQKRRTRRLGPVAKDGCSSDTPHPPPRHAAPAAAVPSLAAGPCAETTHPPVGGRGDGCGSRCGGGGNGPPAGHTDRDRAMPRPQPDYRLWPQGSEAQKRLTRRLGPVAKDGCTSDTPHPPPQHAAPAAGLPSLATGRRSPPRLTPRISDRAPRCARIGRWIGYARNKSAFAASNSPHPLNRLVAKPDA